MEIFYRLVDESIRENWSLSSFIVRGSEHASGFDLRALNRMGEPWESSSLELEPGEVVRFGTGIAVEIPVGYEGQIRPRSSISKCGLIVPVGTIDSDYRGEVGLIVINASRKCWSIEKGERIAQIVFAPVACPVNLTMVKELSQSNRGTNGFGSSGER